MRAVTYQDVGRPELSEVPDPSIQEPDDVVLRVTMSAICGTDLHALNGRIPGMVPDFVLGHEFVGVVEEAGSAVTGIRRGDRAVASCTVPCGHCWHCARREYSRCPDVRIFGYGVVLGDLAGGQAEYVRVPAADLVLHRVDEELGDAAVLFAGDILSTGYDCAVEGRIQPGDTVAVVGCGPVGLCAIQSAMTFEPSAVYAVDSVDNRLEVARRLGAIPVHAGRVHAANAVQEATGGVGVDVVLECVGAFPAFDSALDLVRSGGRISIVGVYAEMEHTIPMGVMFVKAVDIKFCGLANVLERWDAVLDHVRAGRLDPEAIISHRLSLDEAVSGYQLFANRDAVKVVLTP